MFAGAGVVEAFEGGGGRAEQAMGGGELGAFDGNVAGVVAGDGVLLVAGFVFFVDDDQAQAGDGGKDGGAGADDDVGPAGADGVPLGVALGGGQAAVHDGDAGESAAEAVDGLGGEGDFGQENDGLGAAVEGIGDGADVDFGFSAVGDAVEEGDAESAGVQLGADGVEAALLVGVEGDGLDGGFVEAGGYGGQGAEDLAAGDLDPAVALEVLDGDGAAFGPGPDIGDGDGRIGVEGAVFAEDVEDVALLGAAEGGVGVDVGGEVGAFFGFDADALFDGGGDHGSQDLAEGADVVVADPSGQGQEVVVEEGLGVQDLVDGFELEVGMLGGGVGIERFDAEPLHGAVGLSEGDLDAGAGGDGPERVGDGVVEAGVGTGGQGDADDVAGWFGGGGVGGEQVAGGVLCGARSMCCGASSGHCRNRFSRFRVLDSSRESAGL